MKDLLNIDCNAMKTYEDDCGMPFWDRIVTLIVLMPRLPLLGPLIWGATKSVSGKIEMIEKMEKGDTFLCAWTGQYSTDIFFITQKELKMILRAKQSKGKRSLL